MSVAGVKIRSFRQAMYIGILLVIYAALTACSTERVSAAPQPGLVNLKLTDFDPKVKPVIARVIQTGETATIYEGRLSFKTCGKGHIISVWAPGYSIQSRECDGSLSAEYVIPMERLDSRDNLNYAWTAADVGSNSIFNCAKCHADGARLNEYAEWDRDGHSKAFATPSFWTTYMGTNINRLASQETIWSFSPDGTRFRLPPDLHQADYYGPGYQLDYPNASGNCAFCHAPATLGATHQEVNLVPLINGLWENRFNVATEGVTCDVCHKVIDVALDEQRLPFMDRPGILSFTLLRPTSGVQFFAGPWAHLTTSTTDFKRTCAPIFSQSEFCAPCHYAKFSGVEIYSSYKEWLDGPYSKPSQGFRSCQDCHMQASQEVDGTSPAMRGACSAENTSFDNFNHNMMKRDNADNPILIQEAATVTISASREEGRIKVNVNVVNTRAGHKFPTDSPLRHLILVVEARDQNDLLLSQVDGPTIPEWGGTGNTPEDYAGRPGEIYANILKDQDTNMVPAVSYWNSVTPAWKGSDTRLEPNQDTVSQYFFVAPSHGGVKIHARLIYRSAFIDFMHQKGWQRPDILVNWQEVTVE